MHLTQVAIALGAILSTTSAADPELIHIGNVQLNLESTISTGNTPEGDFVYVDIASGWFNTTPEYTAPGYPSSPPLAGTILPGGHDYARLRNDGSIGIDVRLPFRSTGSQSPDLFWYTSSGYVEPGTFVPGTYTHEFGKYDNYQVIRINTNSTRYGWLNAALLVGQERLVIVDSMTRTVELRVFRVVVNPRGREEKQTEKQAKKQGKGEL